MVVDCILSWSTFVTFPVGEMAFEFKVHWESLSFFIMSVTVLFATVDGGRVTGVPTGYALPLVTTQFAAWSRPDSPPLNA